MDIMDKYVIARWCYAIGEDFVDDVEYRCIEDEIRRTAPGSMYLSRSWSEDPCPVELLEKYGLMRLYRDIKIVYKSESIQSINSDAEFELTFRDLAENSRLSFKLDGWNIQVNYYNGSPISAETRGRGGNSLNAAAALKVVPKIIPVLGKVKVTGELVIPNSKWQTFQLYYDNTSQRNSVSTAMANEQTEFLEFLAFNVQIEDEEITRDHYELLSEWGFSTPAFTNVASFGALRAGMKYMAKLAEVYDYPHDGLVIENTRYQLAIRVGRWKEEVMTSYVTGYEEKQGVHGVSMVVRVRPVKYDGAVRGHVDVTNIQCIIDNDLRIGAPVAFDNRSMVTAVLNATETSRLQKEYAGRYGEFQDRINKREEEK